MTRVSRASRAGGEVRRTITTRERNRALLARQGLIEPFDGTITETLERVGGIQDQYAPSGYIGLWTRMRRFEPGELTEALRARSVVQATLMRATIHLVSARDYPPLSAGVRRARREWFIRTWRSRLDGIDLETLGPLVREHLAGGPRRRTELAALLAADGFDRGTWPAVDLWTDLVRVPPSGTWAHRRADLYGLATDALEMPTVTEADGLAHLVRRYLGAFGPASLAEAAGWAGVPVGMLRPVVATLDLRGFRDESGGDLLDLPEAPLPHPDMPAPVRFLPTWDATLLAHNRRSGILPERYRPLVFDPKTPHSAPTFLVDGAVAGTWRYVDGRIASAPFEELPASTRRALAGEAERLAAFHASADGS